MQRSEHGLGWIGEITPTTGGNDVSPKYVAMSYDVQGCLYDGDGNRIDETTTSGTIYVYGAFQYNNDNQLTQVESSLAQGFVSYAYDPFGRIVSRSISNPSARRTTSTTGRTWPWCSTERPGPGARLYGPAVDQILATETGQVKVPATQYRHNRKFALRRNDASNES